MIKFSVIIPVYNEEEAISQVIAELKNYLQTKKYQAEIIVIDDNSQDRTYSLLQKTKDIKLIRHPYNKGYGASLKTGAKEAQFDWLLFCDGDSQHQPQYIENLIKNANGFDMVVGARIGYKGPLLRQPGKILLTWTANYLTQKRIPDLNSGFRLIQKEKFFKYVHLLPDGFSLSSTITVAFLKDRLNIKYIPIRIRKRQGQSNLRLFDGFNAIMTALRITLLFSPLRVFLPVCVLSFILGMGITVINSYYLKELNVSDSAVIFFISSLLFFFFGLLADQISAIRRELPQARE